MNGVLILHGTVARMRVEKEKEEKGHTESLGLSKYLDAPQEASQEATKALCKGPSRMIFVC
jgi:hypothetical protein